MPKPSITHLQPPATAPKSAMILADVGSEWLLPAMWSGCDQCWKVFVGVSIRDYSPEQFSEKLKGWLPVPDMDSPIASITEAVVSARLAHQPQNLLTVAKQELERGALVAALKAYQGNRHGAATALSLTINTLSAKVSTYRLQKLVARQTRSDKGGTHDWS